MKTAIVTGSSYGIGYPVTLKLLDEGYKVYGISRSETKLITITSFGLNVIYITKKK